MDCSWYLKLWPSSEPPRILYAYSLRSPGKWDVYHFNLLPYGIHDPIQDIYLHRKTIRCNLSRIFLVCRNFVFFPICIVYKHKGDPQHICSNIETIPYCATKASIDSGNSLKPVYCILRVCASNVQYLYEIALHNHKNDGLASLVKRATVITMLLPPHSGQYASVIKKDTSTSACHSENVKKGLGSLLGKKWP